MSRESGWVRLAAGIGLVCASFSSGQGTFPERDALIDGVKSIAVPGIPGTISVFGKEAFPVVTAVRGKSRGTVVAAGRLDKGRVVAFGHDGYLASDALSKGDTARLMANALRWAGRCPTGTLRVALLGVDRLGSLPELNDFAVVKGAWDEFDGDQAPDVVVLHAVRVQDRPTLDRIRESVRAGRGLVVGATGWGWAQLNPGKRLERDFAANAVLAEAGLSFAYGMIKRPAAGILAPQSHLSPALHAGEALRLLSERGGLGGDTLAQAVDSVCAAARCVPVDEVLFRPRLNALLRGAEERFVPPRQQPVRRKDGLARIAITLEAGRIRDLPPAAVTAHPAAADFPGGVPAGSARVSVETNVDTGVPRWHSTGCYAAPGETIEVSLPERAVGKGLALRIGAHTDKVWRRDAWWRYPEIARRFKLGRVITQGASAFGGLVYVEVPGDCELGVVPVTIRNVTRAPWYEHGRTDLQNWRERIRTYPAPWAELATEKIIITVPSEHIRDLDAPDELMAFWDSVLDACADLATRPRKRSSPERYVTDRQISVGYMHAGYPIMTFLDAAPRFVDLDRLRGKGDWGMFHEMGHNHQSRDWTFAGTGEVTVNLFSLYVLETCCPGAPRHKAATAEEVTKRANEHVRSGADFSRWKSKPFTALAMYSQMIDAFGWKAFKDVFAEYRALAESERPNSDDEKRDQWLVRFSRTAGRDLGPFFEVWGVPVSAEVRKTVANLPVWMPAGFPETAVNQD